MDLKNYFKRLREIEASITEEYPLIVSVETEDGGKAGSTAEVARQEAAKAIVDGRAVLANAEQAKAYLEQEAERKKAIERLEMAKRLQFAVISDAEFRTTVGKTAKGSEPESIR